MKKFITATLATALALSLAIAISGCSNSEPKKAASSTASSAEATLVRKSVNGITLNIPSNFKDFADVGDGSGVMMAKDGLGSNIVVQPRRDGKGAKPSDMTKDLYAKSIAEDEPGATIIDFKNNANVGGVPAVTGHESFDMSGKKIESWSVEMYYADETIQNITITTKADGNPLYKNADAIVKSIAVK